MRVVLFKVSQERSVSKVLQARGIVGHDVGLSWDEVSSVAVAVKALVFAGKVALVCRRS